MKSVYEDKYLTLRDMRMIQFDPSHDVPSLISVLAKNPQMLDIQDRTLISRILGLATARKQAPTTFLIGVGKLTVLTCLLLYLYGNQSKKKNILTIAPEAGVALHAMVDDLITQLRPEDRADDLKSLIRKASDGQDFLIALMPATEKDDIRSVIDLLTTGRPGVMFIKDYGMLAQTGHLEYCRERGLRIVQLTDGSAELWNLDL
jgi:hypothetical protein